VRAATSSDLDAVRDWLADVALVQDHRVVLFQLACGRLFELGLVRPGLTVIEQSLVGTAREAASLESARRVAPGLTDERRRMLDELLVVDAEPRSASATWLGQFPRWPSPPTGPPWPRWATTAARGCGTPPPARPGPPWPATGTGSGRWPSPPTGPPWPRGATTAECGCGAPTRSTSGRSFHSGQRYRRWRRLGPRL
jgi:hypothetical protein